MAQQTALAPEITISRDGTTVLTFPASADDFACKNAASHYVEDRGFSIGSWQADAPAGILYGNFQIAKWRNLTEVERGQLHGTMEAPGHTGRTGPFIITLFAAAPMAARVDILLQQPSRVPA